MTRCPRRKASHPRARIVSAAIASRSLVASREYAVASAIPMTAAPAPLVSVTWSAKRSGQCLESPLAAPQAHHRQPRVLPSAAQQTEAGPLWDKHANHFPYSPLSLVCRLLFSWLSFPLATSIGKTLEHTQQQQLKCGTNLLRHNLSQTLEGRREKTRTWEGRSRVCEATTSSGKQAKTRRTCIAAVAEEAVPV